MRSRLIPGSVIAALAGATMTIAASSGPTSAFTLSSPSLAEPVLSADVEQVWWDRWGRWHPNHPWGWGWRPWYRPWYWRPYHHPWRRCWWTWSGRVCRWY
ncbi:MAG: hypothetical protein JO288_19645 [Hyphomicrobiales bacterium]|nr:hypothetical protein [Hyphomicrobiales bacterium]